MVVKTGLPIELTKFIRDLLDIETFIETGTGFGRTTEIAKDIFDNVITIEIHDKRYQHVKDKFKDNKNVTCIHGQSPQALKEVLSSRQSIIFLDAHCYFRDAVTDDVCPLLDEINTVIQSSSEHIIIIDDAETFLSCPADAKFNRDNYPELVQVIDALRNGDNNPYIFVEGKSFLSVPRNIKERVDNFLIGERNE